MPSQSQQPTRTRACRAAPRHARAGPWHARAGPPDPRAGPPGTNRAQRRARNRCRGPPVMRLSRPGQGPARVVDGPSSPLYWGQWAIDHNKAGPEADNRRLSAKAGNPIPVNARPRLRRRVPDFILTAGRAANNVDSPSHVLSAAPPRRKTGAAGDPVRAGRGALMAGQATGEIRPVSGGQWIFGRARSPCGQFGIF